MINPSRLFFHLLSKLSGRLLDAEPANIEFDNLDGTCPVLQRPFRSRTAAFSKSDMSGGANVRTASGADGQVERERER